MSNDDAKAMRTKSVLLVIWHSFSSNTIKIPPLIYAALSVIKHIVFWIDSSVGRNLQQEDRLKLTELYI